jgi:hypothetical protein
MFFAGPAIGNLRFSSTEGAGHWVNPGGFRQLADGKWNREYGIWKYGNEE